jgi:hypothetical protein
MCVDLFYMINASHQSAEERSELDIIRKFLEEDVRLRRMAEAERKEALENVTLLKRAFASELDKSRRAIEYRTAEIIKKDGDVHKRAEKDLTEAVAAVRGELYALKAETLREREMHKVALTGLEHALELTKKDLDSANRFTELNTIIAVANKTVELDGKNNEKFRELEGKIHEKTQGQAVAVARLEDFKEYKECTVTRMSDEISYLKRKLDEAQSDPKRHRGNNSPPGPGQASAASAASAVSVTSAASVTGAVSAVSAAAHTETKRSAVQPTSAGGIVAPPAKPVARSIVAPPAKPVAGGSAGRASSGTGSVRKTKAGGAKAAGGEKEGGRVNKGHAVSVPGDDDEGY